MMADFLTDFLDHQDTRMKTRDLKSPGKLYVDGSSNDQGTWASLVLKLHKGLVAKCAIKFGFPASNNKANMKH